MKLPIKSVMACGQGLEEYDLTDADGVLIGTVYEWGAVVKIVAAVNASPSEAPGEYICECVAKMQKGKPQ